MDSLIESPIVSKRRMEELIIQVFTHWDKLPFVHLIYSQFLFCYAFEASNSRFGNLKPNLGRFAAIFSFEGGRKGYFAKQNSPFGLPLKGISRHRRVYFSKRESLLEAI